MYPYNWHFPPHILASQIRAGVTIDLENLDFEKLKNELGELEHKTLGDIVKLCDCSIVDAREIAKIINQMPD